MAFSSNIVQGGQVFQHRLRMLKQLIWLSIKLGLFLGVPYYIYHIYTTVPLDVWHSAYRYAAGLFYKNVLWYDGFDDIIDPVTQDVVTVDTLLSGVHRIKSLTILPRYLFYSLWQALKLLGIIMGVTFVYWFYKGSLNKKIHHVDGTRIVTSRKLKAQLRKAGNFSPYKLAGLPLPQNVVNSHFLVSGTTGSGKTTLFHSFLPQVRAEKGKAVVVDSTGEFVERYYRPGHDILFNPFDEHFPGWSPWEELIEPYHYEEFAAQILPTNSQADPFWVNAARTVLVEAMKQHKWHNNSLEKLLDYLLTAPLKSLHNKLKHTKAGPFLDPDVEKTSLSIRAALANGIQSLSSLCKKGHKESSFTIRKWVQEFSKTKTNGYNDDRWLFLHMSPPQRDTLRPLLSVWVSQIMSSLMELKPGDAYQEERLWFFIDELPALQNLPGLVKCLAEGRKYGASLFLGLQNVGQLESLYGPKETTTILDLCSSKVLFRFPSYDIAERMSRSVGEQEIKEVQEGISYGANDMRDGVNLNTVTKRRPTLYADELMRLSNLEGYIKVAGNYPIAKIKLKI